MWAAKVQASLRIRAVSPEPPPLAHTNRESRGTVRQKARSLAPLNGWACAVKICHDGMLKDTNSLDVAQLIYSYTEVKTNQSCQHLQWLPQEVSFMFYMGNIVKLVLFRSVLFHWFPSLTLQTTYSSSSLFYALFPHCKTGSKQTFMIPKNTLDQSVLPFVVWTPFESHNHRNYQNVCRNDEEMDGWVRVLRPFNSISVISRRWKGERESSVQWSAI